MVRKNGVYVIELAVDKSMKKAAAKMEVDAVGVDGADDGEEVTFKTRLDEADMGVFRRRA
jgi:hypothetical protein